MPSLTKLEQSAKSFLVLLKFLSSAGAQVEVRQRASQVGSLSSPLLPRPSSLLPRRNGKKCAHLKLTMRLRLEARSCQFEANAGVLPVAPLHCPHYSRISSNIYSISADGEHMRLHPCMAPIWQLRRPFGASNLLFVSGCVLLLTNKNVCRNFLEYWLADFLR